MSGSRVCCAPLPEAAERRRDAACCAPGADLWSRRPDGASSGSCSVRSQPGRSGRSSGSGAAALASRVLDPDPAIPAPTGDAVHASSYGLTWLAYGLAEDSPTLLVIDDVHWADAPSLRWLAQLSGHLGEMHLGVLCAVRYGEPSTEPETLTELVAAAPAPRSGHGRWVPRRSRRW